MNITELLAFSVTNKASDLHLSTGLAPRIRIDGDLHATDLPIMEQHEVQQHIDEVMNDALRTEFEKVLEVDFSFELKGLSRFRANVFHQARGVAAVFRIIPSTLLSRTELGLPPVLEELVRYPKGLVLVTGPAGSGKSTTLAAMVDLMNTSQYKHIVSIEDPIEFVHQSKHCLINQREVHRDTLSFNAALRSALREDPDVILLGELRDLESIHLALTAAETGHLVLSTLHTCSAAKTIHRMIDVFPAGEQAMVRSMLSESLRAVVAQTLVKKIGAGRVPALEVMLCTPAIRHLIREDKVAQMDSFMQTGKEYGMHTLEQHLNELVGQGIISPGSALSLLNGK